MNVWEFTHSLNDVTVDYRRLRAQGIAERDAWDRIAPKIEVLFRDYPCGTFWGNILSFFLWPIYGAAAQLLRRC